MIRSIWRRRARCIAALVASSVLFQSGQVTAQESKPLEPSEALKQFQLEDGLTIELVASEPQVVDPVAISFDHLGRMYVAEYRDYPLGPPEGEKPLSRVKLLEDTDGDGVYEKSTIFADVPWVQGVLAHGNGVVVTASPFVYYLEDTDGDGKADVKQELLEGFGFGNPQLRVGHPKRGLDQKVYLTNGLTGGNVKLPGQDENVAKPVTMGRSDLAYDPLKKTFELVPGQAQFGNTFSDFGDRFFCTNRNPVIYAPLSMKTLNRNPFAPILTPQEDVAPSGGACRVYPKIETKTTAISHAGTHTAACGTHVYRGSQFGYDTTNDFNVFVCEPTGSLVTRTILNPKGTSFTSRRPYERKDFLTSTDPWFRPVSLADGPDGSLYLADMYREVIEHPQYMPPGLAETLRLREGENRGRIYRIRRTDKKFEKWNPASNTEGYLALLQDKNGWRRDLGQRRLLETATKENAAQIIAGAEALVSNQDPRVAVQALWTLAGLERQGLLGREQLQKVVQQSIQSENPHVVEHAIRVASFLELPPDLLKGLKASDPQMTDRVAMFWIDAVATSSTEQVQDEIGKLVARAAGDRWIQQLAVTLPPEHSASLLTQLLKSQKFLTEGSDAERELISYLANIIGRRAVKEELAEVLTEVLKQKSDNLPWWRSATLFGIQQGLLAGKGLDGKKNLAQLAALPDEQIAQPAKDAIAAMALAVKTVADPKANLVERRAAIPALNFISVEEATPIVHKLMTSDEDASIQRATFTALAGRAREPLVKEMFGVWGQLGPNSRALVIEVALAHPVTSKLLLETMVEGKISPALLTIEQRDPLLMSRNTELNSLAVKLFGQATSTDRAAVIEKYKGALTAKGDVERGRAVFRRICAQCHKVGNEGAVVGPELSDIRAKGNETLLSDILDPSRAIEPRWTSYIAVMEDGRVINGLLVRESSSGVVIRKAQGIEDTLPRNEIEVLKAAEQSLMPSGIEREVDVQQMADLLAFLKSDK